MNSSQGREVTQLTTKMSATFSEGFSSQYNSPKTFNGKGFALSKSPHQNPTLYPRRQKEGITLVQGKTKAAKGPTAVPESKAPGQKTLSNSALNFQTSGVKEEKRSSSKLKCETLRTVSSTPKNPVSYKGAESVRREENDSTSYQPRWKKLEISTDFNNVKNSYASKAQTTKHTEAEEAAAKEAALKAQGKQTPMNNAQKGAQGKNEAFNNYNFYTQQNKDEAKAKVEKIMVDTKARTPRPLTSYGNSAKNSSVSPQTNPKGLVRTASVKDNMKVSTASYPSEREKNASKMSYRKDKPTVAATPKASLTYLGNDEPNSAGKKYLTTVNADLKSESTKAKARPLSAKKVAKEPKDEYMTERASSKDDKTPTQKVSLQSFVTKVNKGDAFSSINKYGDNKRDNSVQRTQKPQLNIEEKPAKSGRAIDIDLKGNKTTTNSEVRGLGGNLTKSSVQLAPSASTQSLVQKNAKNAKLGGTPAKESQRAAANDLPHPRPQTRDPFVYYMTGLEKAHRWTGGADYFAQLYREHFVQSFQALNFVKSLKAVDPAIIAQKRVNLPRKDIHKDKKTLIFDMDETLIHCNESADVPSDVILPISFPTGEVIEAGINVRPYALECLRELSQHYEIVVFTASHACYANVVLDHLDPKRELIQHRLFRESCVVTEEGVHIKDLRVIGNRNMHDMILVDNAAYSFGLQIENGIPIIPFYDSKNDQELKHLIPFLKFLNTVKDIRDIIKSTFKMHTYSAHDSPDTLLQKVILSA